LTWDPNGGIPFDEKAKQEIFEQLDQSYISGITFSGGDPLHQANHLEVKNLMAEIKEKYPEKTIWLYTGSVWEEVYQSGFMKYVDVLVDGEFVIGLKDQKLLWKGSSNQRVINVPASLQQADPRIPVLHCKDYSY
jgi:anaerobic ribonucleoside-triphosphate reductase activating protein